MGIPTESWYEYPGDKRYQVSTRGSVRGVSGKVMSPSLDKTGRYFRVKIAGRTVYVHTLVLETFVGLRPKGHECHHIDKDSKNNDISNLVWLSSKEHLDLGHIPAWLSRVHEKKKQAVQLLLQAGWSQEDVSIAVDLSQRVLSLVDNR